MCWLTRCHPFGEARLIDTSAVIDFAEETTPDDVVTVVASQALTDKEVWNVMERGSLEVFRGGTAQLRAPVRRVSESGQTARRTLG